MGEGDEKYAADGLALRGEDDAVLVGLVAQRRIIAQRLLGGASGVDITGALSDLADGVFLGCYRKTLRQGSDALNEAGRTQCCCVALGSFGRRELAPYSDIDVMFLFRSEAGHLVQRLSKSVMSVWGAGFGMRHSVRTVEDGIGLAQQDPAIRIAFMDARFLAGSADVFKEFHRRMVRHVVTQGFNEFLEELVTHRRREYEEQGGTTSAPEPNLLKGPGGLRDLHLMRWAGMARCRAETMEALAGQGLLSSREAVAVMDAQDFLWRVRALLHFQTRMAYETLTFEAQLWLAERLGCHDRPHLMGVERFMQQYYRHVTTVHDVCARVLERCRRPSFAERIARLRPAPRLEQHFLIRGDYLDVPAGGRAAVLESPDLLMRLFDVARLKQMPIAREMLERIRAFSGSYSGGAFHTKEVAATFMNILSGPGAAQTLMAMHRVRLLEQVLPEMENVRGLKPFTRAHQYPVDEHCLLAVGEAESLSGDRGLFGSAYEAIQGKAVLHLALLLHDIGKGQAEDHCDAGKRIAEETAVRLGFGDADRRMLIFLVQHHLLMSRLAFGRELDEGQGLEPFVLAVGSAEALRALLVLTAADIAAGGMNALTKWKEARLADAYHRALAEFSGTRVAVSQAEHLRDVARQVTREPVLTLTGGVDEAGVIAQLEHYPRRALYRMPPRQIAGHLAAMRRLRQEEVVALSEFSSSTGTCEYSVITRDTLIPGIFSKIAGVLAANRLQILDAHILTRADGVVMDSFQVADPEYPGAPPADRLKSITQSLVSVLKGRTRVEDLMKRSAHWSVQRAFPVARRPTEVRVDHQTSERYTIFEVVADDRQGLLFIIAQTFFRLGLSVQEASIATRQDRVADAFSVTDGAGRKIVDRGEVEAIRIALTEDIERFLGPGVTRFTGAFDEAACATDGV